MITLIWWSAQYTTSDRLRWPVIVPVDSWQTAGYDCSMMVVTWDRYTTYSTHSYEQNITFNLNMRAISRKFNSKFQKSVVHLTVAINERSIRVVVYGHGMGRRLSSLYAICDLWSLHCVWSRHPSTSYFFIFYVCHACSNYMLIKAQLQWTGTLIIWKQNNYTSLIVIKLLF